MGSVPFGCCVAFSFVFVLFSDFSFIFVFLFLAFDVLGIVRVEEGVDDDHNCYITPGTGELMVNKKVPLPDFGKTSILL